MVQSIGETLSVGRDAVYRRLRGDTILTADELIVLSRKYRLPIDDARSLSDVPKMYYHNGSDKISSDYQYFLGLRQQTERMVEMGETHVDYATPELPIYYELSPPVLRAFKVYIYGVTTWSLKKWEGVAFRPQLISPQTNGVIEDIIADAYRLPGRELWSIGILDVTLRQITYMAQVGKFAEKEYLEIIFDELHGVVDHLELMARSGKRFPMGSEPGPDSPTFQVYHNELSNTNNAVIVNSKSHSVMFSTLVNPNYVMSDDPRILADVNRWFERLIAGGNALSADAAKYTTRYFGHLRQQIDTAKSRSLHAGVAF